jgi:hypothetical protein
MRRQRVIEVSSLAVVALACLAILLVTWPLPPSVDRRLHQEIATALAAQVRALVGFTGQVTVITRDTDLFPQPALNILLQTFERELRKASIKIGSIQRLQVDPLRPAEVPAGDFFELIRHAPPGSVIVSFLGPPLLADEQWQRLRPIKPKIVAFCSGTVPFTVDLRSLFEAGYLHAAVVSRPEPQNEAPTSVRSGNRFDELYMTVTAADAAGMLPYFKTGS